MHPLARIAPAAEPKAPGGVFGTMRISRIAGAVVLSVALMASGAGCSSAPDVGPISPREANLIAFVGRRLSIRYAEPKDNEARFDAEYRVHVEVLELVFGKYPSREMEFSSFVH